MIENSMFEEEPDVVDLAKEPGLHPLEPDEVEYEPRSSRLLVRGLGENEMDEDEEDYESSAKLLGLSFMNRSSGSRNNALGYSRQGQDGSCSMPSGRTMIVCSVVLVIVVSVVMVVYLLPKCTFTKEGCHPQNHTANTVYPFATNGQIFPWANSRLPSALKPLNYDLFLHPNLTTMSFSGSVHITLYAASASKNVILHSAGLSIKTASISSKSGVQGSTAAVLEYPAFDQIAIIPSEPILEKNTYTLSIEFASNLSSTYSGFYKSKYKEEDAGEGLLAATQFEPLSARKAFPCFDEPAFKATFVIKIIRDEKHIALSNMPKTATIPEQGGLLRDEFAASVKMSTYLVAFIISDMKNITDTTGHTVVSVFSIPTKINQVQYALETAVKLLNFYEMNFNITYPLKKLDLVAIPDFQAGAMENWGLITFRETTLLYDEGTSSILDKRMITAVIAHEIAHQWFGNLVTMEWWNDLWLNEGFATYMEYFSLQKAFTDLQADDDFLDIRFKAMMKDSLNSSHPLSTNVQSPEQIEEMFDVLSYLKGASILLMLQDSVTEEVFLRGITIYLSDHRYGSTKSDDLWDSMNKAKGISLDVKQLMRTWITQEGLPLVTVIRNGTNVTLRQERYLRNADARAQTPGTRSLWHIPLTYLTSSCRHTPVCINKTMLEKETGDDVSRPMHCSTSVQPPDDAQYNSACDPLSLTLQDTCERRKEHFLKDGKTEQLKEELEKKNAEMKRLKKVVTQWEAKYKEVKARNAQLLKMLQEGEMKDKADILLQVDELLTIKNELTIQVTGLHVALEQERSKVKGLQAELLKYQGGKKGKRNAETENCR